MLREFQDLVNEAISEGHAKGVELFMESLERDLRKENLFESEGVDKVVAYLFEQEGYEIVDPKDLDQMDEEKMDAMLQQMEKEGDIE